VRRVQSDCGVSRRQRQLAQVAVTVVAVTLGFVVISAIAIGVGNARRGSAQAPQPAI
jgi:hypothetical protein